MEDWGVLPDDLASIQWHRDPLSNRYRSPATAARSCTWLNSNPHRSDSWLYRPGPVDLDGGVRLERRWVGRSPR